MATSHILGAVHRVATWLSLGIGVVHTVGTFFFFDGLSEMAIRFAGAGLGAIFAALLNFGLAAGSSSVGDRRRADLANAVFVLWLAAGVAATPELPSFLVLGSGALMAVSGLCLPRTSD